MTSSDLKWGTVASAVGVAAICASVLGTAGVAGVASRDASPKVVDLSSTQGGSAQGVTAVGTPAVPEVAAPLPAADPGAGTVPEAPAPADALPPALAALPEAPAPAVDGAGAAPAAPAVPPAGAAPAAPGAAAPASPEAAAPQQGQRHTRSPNSVSEANAQDLVVTAQRPSKIDLEWQYAAWLNPRVPMQAKLDASHRGNDPEVKKVLERIQATNKTYDFLSIRGTAVGATRYRGNRAWQDFRGTMAGFPVLTSKMAYIWDGGRWKFDWSERMAAR